MSSACCWGGSLRTCLFLMAKLRGAQEYMNIRHERLSDPRNQVFLGLDKEAMPSVKTSRLLPWIAKQKRSVRSTGTVVCSHFLPYILLCFALHYRFEAHVGIDDIQQNQHLCRIYIQRRMSCTFLAHPLSSVATVLHFIIEITVLLLKKKKNKTKQTNKKKTMLNWWTFLICTKREGIRL